MRTSTLPHHNVALVILCRADGAIVETLHDEYSLIPRLPAGSGFTGLIEDADVPKAGRFLRTAAANSSALDWQLNVALPPSAALLYFTAALTTRGIVILGAKQPICRSQAETGTLAEFEPVRILEIAAHDLRNPVSGILAASEYLMEDIKGALEEHHLSLLRSIQSSSRLILRRIDEMLEVPAIDEDEPRLHFQSTDLASLVDRSAEANRPLAENRRIRLEVETRGTVPRLNLDPRKMSQAISALLRNEIKCSRPGSRIEVLVDAPGTEATITVRDQGPGIAPAHLRNLFDPFRSCRPKRGLMEARTSLTLAAVKRIVEGHRGSIRVESEMRKGSSFTLHLPLTIGSAADAADAAADGSRGKRVVRNAASRAA